MILDPGPLIQDADNPNSQLWSHVRYALEIGEPVYLPHTVLAQVMRNPQRQVNLNRLLRMTTLVALDDGVAVGVALSASATSDVVDAHVAVLANSYGDFVLTTDPDDMYRLGVRHERYGTAR